MTNTNNKENKDVQRTEERAQTWARLKAMRDAPPAAPLEVATKFFNTYFADESWEEARVWLSKRVIEYPRSVLEGLAGIELLLADPSVEQGTLSDLVAWQANWVLDDPSDEGAKVWLREVAEMVRELLGDKQPPRPLTR